MADFGTGLTQRLIAAGIAGGRVHWVDVPQGSARPYVVLQVVSDPRPQHLKGYDLRRVTRVQADCVADSYAAARATAEAVIAAVAQPATVGGVQFGRGKAEGPRDLSADGVNGLIHRANLDLLIEHKLA